MPLVDANIENRAVAVDRAENRGDRRAEGLPAGCRSPCDKGAPTVLLNVLANVSLMAICWDRGR
jgi:hypothetical protein